MLEISDAESWPARLLAAAARKAGAWLAEVLAEVLRRRAENRAAIARRRTLDGLSTRLQRDLGLAEAEIARAEVQHERLRREIQWPRPW